MNNREAFEKVFSEANLARNGNEYNDYVLEATWRGFQAAKAHDAELIAELVEALSHYTNVVESVYDPNDWGTKVRDAGSFARDALAKVKERV